MWTSKFSIVAYYCSQKHKVSSNRWHEIPLEAIIVIALALITCCNCFEGSNYNDRHTYKRATSEKKEIHLAGIFPINGDKGWQGGQVRSQYNDEQITQFQLIKHVVSVSYAKALTKCK